MTITLDYVSLLLHISIVRQFPPYVLVEFITASTILVGLLGVDLGDATFKWDIVVVHTSNLVDFER